jgi:hypothetical protein
VLLTLESDLECQNRPRVPLAAHSASEVRRLAVHAVENIHHGPDVWQDEVARPVLIGRHGWLSGGHTCSERGRASCRAVSRPEGRRAGPHRSAPTSLAIGADLASDRRIQQLKFCEA